MKVKICGITNEDDAHAAIEAGAHALGFIFADASPRCVAPGDVCNIIKSLPPFVTTVGVFVNSSREKVLRTIQATGIQAMQFHGDESPEELQGYLLPTYKAFRVDERFDVTSLQQYQSKIFLLDTFVDGVRGGTGKTFNWSIAIEAKRFGRVVLSGGLSPENIAEAVRTVQPYAVDVNSGVESSPGKKDKHKLKDLFSALWTTQEFAC
jgi:phosphoribosylanthranilate isomerase